MLPKTLRMRFFAPDRLPCAGTAWVAMMICLAPLIQAGLSTRAEPM
jgi:hypothetical protein